MSQYIQGVVDYLPMIQPFKPDLNFFQKVLETKEAQYKAGYDKLSSLYGTLLDSPMLRTENIELRNKFFNQISSDINKISGLDLSLNQNVEAAQKVFQPILDNDYIIKDMTYTKNAYNELQRAEDFRNCTDEKKCGGKYWEGGVRAIQYQMADFAKSSADESLGFSSPRYTPSVNLGEKAMKFAKDMGFNMQTVSFTKDGNYRITTKNGEQMIPYLTDAFVAAFQNDQSAVDYYKTKSYLERKDFAASSVDQYGSEEAAEMFYLDQMSKDLLDKSSKEKDRADKGVKQAQNKQTVAEQTIQSTGVDPNNKTDQNLVKSRNQAMVDAMILQSSSDYHNKTKETLNPETYDNNSLSAKRQRIDSAVANSLFYGDLKRSASDYAMLNFEQEMTEDKFALSRFDHSLAIARMDAQFQYDLAKLDVEQQYKIQFEKIQTADKLLIKSYGDGTDGSTPGDPTSKSANPASNNYETLPTTDVALDPNLIGSDEKAFLSQSSAMTSDLQSYAHQTNQLLNTIIKSNVGTVLPSGVPITPELKEWAKNKQSEVFGKGQTGYVEQEVEVTEEGNFWADGLIGAGQVALGTLATGVGAVATFFGAPTVAGSVAGVGLMGAGTAMGGAGISNIMNAGDPVTKKVKKQVGQVSGGYVDENGNLIDMARSNDFQTNGNNNWFQVGQRIDALVNDPQFQKLMGPASKSASIAKQRYDDSKALYFTYLDGQKNNNTAVANATLATVGAALTADFDNPTYAYEQLSKINAGGQYKTRDQFINEYVTEARKLQSGAGMQGSTGLSSLGAFAQHGDDYYRGEAEDLYDEYKKYFEANYNQTTDATVKNIIGYKNLAYGFNPAAGAGVQANSLRVSGVDSAYRGDLGARDFMGIYKDVQNAMMSNPGSVKFLKGPGINTSIDTDLDAYEDNTVLDLIHSHMMSGRKASDDTRARFDMTLHPIFAGDVNKVGVTIKLDNDFIESYKGTDKNAKALRGKDSEFTIVMDKDNVTSDAFKRLDRGPFQMMMDLNGQYNLSQFAEYGGNLTFTPSSAGGYNGFGSVKFVGDDGKIRDMVYNVDSGPNANADQFITAQAQMLDQLYDQVYAYSQAIRNQNPNIITDPNYGKPQE